MSSSEEAERARLFVALELPTAVRDALVRWGAEAVRGVHGVRPVAREALHVTLCFLGWRDASEIETIGEACAAGLREARSLELSLGHALWLPARRPRVLAVGIEDGSGTLSRVQSSVGAALIAGGWYARETRPFLGHVTVARVGHGARVRGVELPPSPSSAFTGTTVTLFRSRLGQEAARYEALRPVELGATVVTE